MEEFITILKNETAEIVEKKSKFIANLFHVESVEEAENRIKDIKKKYHDARHNCIAYRVAENGQIIEKSSDDGEPSGTAGGPMLNILQKNNLCNVIVIVTRYFGGILLGTGGLVRAYSDCTIGAVNGAKKFNLQLGEEVEVEVAYADFKQFMHYCKVNEIRIAKSDYKEFVVCKLEINEEKKKKILYDVEFKKINVNKIDVIGKTYIIE